MSLKMNWTKTSDKIRDDDRPRKLTEKELVYIAEQIPMPPSADRESALLIREQIVDWIIKTLSELELSPSAIPELIKIMVEKHYSSLSAPGTPTGFICAESIGAKSTQGALNTFHSSGSLQKGINTLDGLNSIVFGRSPKNPQMTIYFKNKQLTYEDVILTRSFIVGSNINDFVTKSELIPVNDETTTYWNKLYCALFDLQLPESNFKLRLNLSLEEMYQHKVTPKMIAEALERDETLIAVIPSPTNIATVDIYCNMHKMDDISKKIEKIFDNNIPTDMEDVMDLLEKTFLKSIVEPELKSIRVKGIAGITGLYPVVSPVLRVLTSEKKISQKEAKDTRKKYNNYWILRLNDAIMKISGIKSENVAALCKNAGLSVIRVEETEIIISMPDDRYKSNAGKNVYIFDGAIYEKIDEQYIVSKSKIYTQVSLVDFELVGDNWTNGKLNYKVNKIVNLDGKKYYEVENSVLVDKNAYKKLSEKEVKELLPSQYIIEKVNIDKEANKSKKANLEKELELKALSSTDDDEKKKLLSKRVVVEPTKLMKSAEFVIAETEGTNLRDVLSLPSIDKKCTVTNDMLEVTTVLGIEAARSCIIRELQAVMAASGSYIHPASISLLGEVITARGQPHGASFTGMLSGTKAGHITLATVERAGAVFSDSACQGKEESTVNVSAAVGLGARMKLGDGYFHIGTEIDGKTFINDDVFNLDFDKKVKPELEKLTDEDLAPFKLEDPGFDFDISDDKKLDLITGFNSNIPSFNQSTKESSKLKANKRTTANLIGIVKTDRITNDPVSDQIFSKNIVVPKEKTSYTTPLVSTGFIDIENLTIQTCCTDLPDELKNLFDKYSDEMATAYNRTVNMPSYNPSY